MVCPLENDYRRRMIFIATNYYECDVIKKIEKVTNNVRFENYGFIIKHKEIEKGYLKYHCLLTQANKIKIQNSQVFKLVKDSDKEFSGTIYTIYCDGGVYNYGNDKDSIKLSALSVIVYKDGTEIFRTTNVYEQFLDNNITELLAVLVAFRHLYKTENRIHLKNSKIIISSDSQNLQSYIIRPKVIKSVIKKCKAEEVSTYYSEIMRELLNELYFYLNCLDVYISWVKGHTPIKTDSSKATLMNNICDKLCKNAIKEKLQEMNLSDYKEQKRKRR